MFRISALRQYNGPTWTTGVGGNAGTRRVVARRPRPGGRRRGDRRTFPEPVHVITLAGYLAATRYHRADWADPSLPDGDPVSAPPDHWHPWFHDEPTVTPPGHHVLAVGVPDHYLSDLPGSPSRTWRDPKVFL